MKRWRPRWSIRILLIVITLICAYLACWGPTKRQGVADVKEHFSYPTFHLFPSPELPLVVSTDDYYGRPPTRHYYFWFFGYVAKLPYERRIVNLD